jgi:hypothetical protein
MVKRKEDQEREERINMEIIVDAYDPEERATGWYYYLKEKIQFPLTAVCNVRRVISPLQVGDEVDVQDMAPENECQHEMFVMVPWGKQDLAVPLSQLRPVHGTDESTEALEDWIYWKERGYEF